MGQVEGLEKFLKEQPVFQDLDADSLAFVAGCAMNRRYEVGEYLFEEGDDAALFFLLRHGTVAVEARVPGRQPIVIQTLHEGDVLGWSWLAPPHRCTFDARATTLVRALSIDAVCLRNKCEQNHELGYRIFVRFAGIMADLLHSARMQMLDVYGPPQQGARQ
ncbi:MAG: cyclic nucleotide-binding domain-containing protein [Alphaproteobacteria bacterium]